jgi:hypothetical protein
MLWQSMLANKPIEQYMTNSDLAFTIIIVEHYMMNWRRLIHYKWETGHLPPSAYCKQACGFLYKHGIDGEVAKKRYESLCLYFFSNFSKTNCPTKRKNLARLQSRINAAIKIEYKCIKTAMTGSASLVSAAQVKQLQDDIAHCVFYKLYL